MYGDKKNSQIKSIKEPREQQKRKKQHPIAPGDVLTIRK